MATYNIRTSSVQDWRDSMMSKAEFNAMAAERRANRAGSGFDEFGKTYNDTVGYPNVNDGLWTGSIDGWQNTFQMGYIPANSQGTSKTTYPIASINGVNNKIFGINGNNDVSAIKLPSAPTVLPYTATLTQQQIDSGVIKHADASNSGLIIGGTGLTGTTFTQTINTVNGKKYVIEYVDSTVRKTLEVTASTSTYGVSLSGTDITRVAVFPADAISRSDLVFLRKRLIDVSVNDFFYPLGNTQFLGTISDAGTTVAGTFSGSTTYSLFSSTWQVPSALIGKGYVWSTLSDLNKKAVTANQENNAYLDGDKVYQAQYGAKVEMMKGDYFTEATAFTALGYTIDTIDKGLYKHSDGSEAIGICLVHRRNQGFMHPVYNPNGTKLASDSLPWHSTTVSFTSIADCFTDSKLLATSGYIGTTTGRSDGIFYDQIHEGDITDLRNNSRGINDYARTMDTYMGKLQASTYRGTEGEVTILTSYNRILNYGSFNSGVNTRAYFIQNADAPTFPVSLVIGEVKNYTAMLVVKTGADAGKILVTRAYHKGDSTYFVFGDNTILPTIPVRYTDGSIPSTLTGQTVDIYVAYSSTRTKSNTITHTDIIGSPANYPTAWKQSGVSGVPLIVAEDGTSLLPTGTTGSDGLAVFKLSRKANAAPLQVLKSTDNGVTWTALTVTTHYTFNTTTNAITFTAGNIPLVAHLVMVTYQTHTNMCTATVNSEALAIGDPLVSNSSATNWGAYLTTSLSGKVQVNATQPFLLSTKLTQFTVESTNKFATVNTFPVINSPITIGGTTGAIKVFPYLTRSNGKAYLNLVFKEMKYGSYAAPTVVTAASAAYTINMTYKINIAGCALDGKVIQWTATTATSAIDWSLYDVSPTGVIYLLSSGAVYANARLYDGDSWGDDSKFNIVDNVSTTTDTNGAIVLIGQKRVELPYFISAAE